MKKIIFTFLLFLLIFNIFPINAAELETIDQAALTRLVNENRGKVILLNFFATWCPPCRAEIPELVKISKDYNDDQLLIMGLSVDDDLDAVLPFMKKNGVNYPVYKAEKNITEHFGISSVPHNTFFAKDGKMVISEPGMADSEILHQVIDDLIERD